MAYIGDEHYLSVWWPGPLPEEVLAGNYLDFPGLEPSGDGFEPPAEPLFGYIIQDWFGPFLLSPPSRCSPGRC